MVEKVVVVVSGGWPPDAEAVFVVPLDAPVIAADRGVEHAQALGLPISLAIGDFDSVDSAALAAAEAAGARIERHPTEKDATDLELALDAAVALHPERVLVLSGGGDRLDHLLGELLLLASARYESVAVDALVGRARCHVVRGERTLLGEVGELVSLFAVHAPAEGVATEGLSYPLVGETLEPGSTRGASNVFAAEAATISLESGVVLVVRPGSTS